MHNVDIYRESNYRGEREKKRKRGNTQFSMGHGIAREEAPTCPSSQIYEAPFLDHRGDSLGKEKEGHAYPSNYFSGELCLEGGRYV
jgi:hypothetical protein